MSKAKDSGGSVRFRGEVITVAERRERLLRECGLERIHYESARARGGFPTMKWMGVARWRAEFVGGCTVREIEVMESTMLAESAKFPTMVEVERAS